MKIFRKSGGALSSYLGSNISKLRKSKTLIISSAPAPAKQHDATPQKVDRDLQRYLTLLQEHIGKCEFYTSMQYNLKTVSYGKNTLFGAYPTKNDIESTMELMRRTGATNIIGVGSGAAMDLAKICFYEYSNQDDSFLIDGAQLILNPSTLGATLTSTSRDCLSLCTQEEALIPYYCPEALVRREDLDHVNVILDEKAIALPMWITSGQYMGTKSEPGKNHNATVVDCMYASLVIALDVAHSLVDSLEHDAGMEFHENNHYKLLDDCVESAVKCLDIIKSTTSLDDPMKLEATIQESKGHAINTMVQAGSLLSFGNNSSTTRRNISIALTSSLLPAYFPNGNWTTFTASLLPGLCDALGRHYGLQSAVKNQALCRVIAGILGCNESSVKCSHLLEWVNDISKENACLPVPTLTRLAQGAPDIDELLNKLDENGALLNCKDARASYFESILVSSLDR
jgi:hypothetical protein